MIPGWEKETQPLLPEEEPVAEAIRIRFMAGEFAGKGRAVTSMQLQDEYQYKGKPIRGARIRKIINHLRISGKVPLLMATGSGYYTTSDVDDVKRYIQSLSHREQAIAVVRKSLQKQLTEKMHQASLWPEEESPVLARRRG